MINPAKLHNELLVASLPVDGVHEDGTVDWTRELTQEEQTLVDSVIANHNPIEIELPTYEQRITDMEDVVKMLIFGG